MRITQHRWRTVAASLTGPSSDLERRRTITPRSSQLNQQLTPPEGGNDLVKKVSLSEKLALFEEHWSPKIIARLNDYDVQIAKVLGEFVWHKHEGTDEFFLVLKGRLTIQMRNGDVELGPGELFVVPKGVE